VIDAGTLAQLGRERREQDGAVGPQQVEGVARGRGVARRQDPGAGPRRLATEVALVHDQDTQVLARQEVRGGQADDTAADDANVGMRGHEVVRAVPGRRRHRALAKANPGRIVALSPARTGVRLMSTLTGPAIDRLPDRPDAPASHSFGAWRAGVVALLACAAAL